MRLATAIVVLAVLFGFWGWARTNVDPRFVGRWSSPNPSPGVEFLVFDIDSSGRGAWSHRIGDESWTVAKFTWEVHDGAIEFRRHYDDARHWIPAPLGRVFNLPPYFEVMRYNIETVNAETIRLCDADSGQVLDLQQIND